MYYLMGRFRCLSKPFKRFYFNYADQVADKWSIIVVNKYRNKYINKRKKLGIDNENKITENEDCLIIPGLDDFIFQLKTKLDKEKTLAHGKVREYWLRRGPRLSIVLVLTILITLGLAQLLTEPTTNENILSILVGSNMILFNFYMLYQRLIDAISGTMMRVGHDHYINWKQSL